MYNDGRPKKTHLWRRSGCVSVRIHPRSAWLVFTWCYISGCVRVCRSASLRAPVLAALSCTEQRNPVYILATREQMSRRGSELIQVLQNTLHLLCNFFLHCSLCRAPKIRHGRQFGLGWGSAAHGGSQTSHLNCPETLLPVPTCYLS